jgi:hypothetical protein
VPALFKQRLVTLPTLWGLILIGLIVGSILSFSFSQLAFFLAPNKPIHGQYLVVEGWIGEHALLEAIEIYQHGPYQLLITTGGPETRELNPQYASYAEKAAAFLLTQGFDAKQLAVAPAPASAQNRTFLSAVKVRHWFRDHNITPSAFDIFSSGVHARRTHQLYQMAFYDDTHIGIIPAKTDRYQLNTWWQSSEGMKSVLTEFIGVVYTFCCFDPGPPHSHQELWGVY